MFNVHLSQVLTVDTHQTLYAFRTVAVPAVPPIGSYVQVAGASFALVERVVFDLAGMVAVSLESADITETDLDVRRNSGWRITDTPGH